MGGRDPKRGHEGDRVSPKTPPEPEAKNYDVTYWISSLTGMTHAPPTSSFLYGLLIWDRHIPGHDEAPEGSLGSTPKSLGSEPDSGCTTSPYTCTHARMFFILVIFQEYIGRSHKAVGQKDLTGGEKIKIRRQCLHMGAGGAGFYKHANQRKEGKKYTKGFYVRLDIESKNKEESSATWYAGQKRPTKAKKARERSYTGRQTLFVCCAPVA